MAQQKFYAKHVQIILLLQTDDPELQVATSPFYGLALSCLMNYKTRMRQENNGLLK